MAQDQQPPEMTEGRITLLYKGKGLDRALPASYRPITLLNTDYKLAARVLADRFGPLLNHVVDSTQTGFLSQRWIGYTTSWPTWRPSLGISTHSSPESFSSRRPLTGWAGLGCSAAWQSQALEQALSVG